MDKTEGNSNWWGCGSGCPGAKNRTDGTCGCACIEVPEECVEAPPLENTELAEYKCCSSDAGS